MEPSVAILGGETPYILGRSNWGGEKHILGGGTPLILFLWGAQLGGDWGHRTILKENLKNN